MKFGKKTVHSEVGSIAIYVGIIEHWIMQKGAEHKTL